MAAIYQSDKHCHAGKEFERIGHRIVDYGAAKAREFLHDLRIGAQKIGADLCAQRDGVIHTDRSQGKQAKVVSQWAQNRSAADIDQKNQAGHDQEKNLWVNRHETKFIHAVLSYRS